MAVSWMQLKRVAWNLRGRSEKPSFALIASNYSILPFRPTAPAYCKASRYDPTAFTLLLKPSSVYPRFRVRNRYLSASSSSSSKAAALMSERRSVRKAYCSLGGVASSYCRMDWCLRMSCSRTTRSRARLLQAMSLLTSSTSISPNNPSFRPQRAGLSLGTAWALVSLQMERASLRSGSEMRGTNRSLRFISAISPQRSSKKSKLLLDVCWRCDAIPKRSNCSTKRAFSSLQQTILVSTLTRVKLDKFAWQMRLLCAQFSARCSLLAPRTRTSASAGLRHASYSSFCASASCSCISADCPRMRKRQSSTSSYLRYSRSATLMNSRNCFSSLSSSSSWQIMRKCTFTRFSCLSSSSRRCRQVLGACSLPKMLLSSFPLSSNFCPCITWCMALCSPAKPSSSLFLILSGGSLKASWVRLGSQFARLAAWKQVVMRFSSSFPLRRQVQSLRRLALYSLRLASAGPSSSASELQAWQSVPSRSSTCARNTPAFCWQFLLLYRKPVMLAISLWASPMASSPNSGSFDLLTGGSASREGSWICQQSKIRTRLLETDDMIRIQRWSGTVMVIAGINMASQAYQKWLTLVGHCFATYSNAVGFALFFTNISVFEAYYNVSEQAIEQSYYVGLILQLLFCVPALKLIEWRMDYSLMCAAFLSMAAYWVQVVSQGNFIVTICCMALSSFGQAILLPLSAYLAERWFPLEQRSIAISLSFYSNLLGFASGAIYTTLFVTSVNRVMRQMFVVAVASTFCFVVAVVLVKNKPKVLMEKYRLASWKQLKELWKYKFNTYSIFMSSVFLGASWSFLSSISELSQFSTPQELAIYIAVWIVSGCGYGLIMSGIISHWISESGTFTVYDRMSKATLLVGVVGYVLMGVCITFGFRSFVGYLFLMVIIGIGSIGYYGLMLLSLIETFYPLSSLIIGNLIVVGASLYSALATAMGMYLGINIYFSLAAVTLLPFVYLAVTYSTDFKRYRYYLDEKSSKYTLLKIDDYKSLFNDKKYE